MKRKHCFIMGVLGAVLFSLIGPIDWLIMDSFGMFGGILPILIPVAAFIGFRLFYGKITKTCLLKAFVTSGIVFFVIYLLTWYGFLCKEVFLSTNSSLAEKGLKQIGFFGVLVNFKLVLSMINWEHLFVLITGLLFGFEVVIFEMIDSRRIIFSLIKLSQNEGGKNSLNEIKGKIVRGSFAVGVFIAALASVILAAIWFVIGVLTSTGFQMLFCILIPLLSLVFYRRYVRKLVREISDLTKDLIGEIICIVISIVCVIVTWQCLFSVYVFADFTNWFMKGWVTSAPSVFDCFKPSVRALYYEICFVNNESIWTLMDPPIQVLMVTLCFSFSVVVPSLNFFFYGYLYDVESWGLRRKNSEVQQKEDSVEEGCGNNQHSSEIAESSGMNNMKK